MDKVKQVEDALRQLISHSAEMVAQIKPAHLAAGLAACVSAKVVTDVVSTAIKYHRIDAVEVEGQHWLLGAVPLIQQHGGEMFSALDTFFKKYGGLFKMRLLNTPFLVVSDVEVLREVMIKSDYPKGSFYEHLLPFLGRGVVFINGDEWKIHRKAINPAFGSIALKTLQPTFAKLTAKLVALWKEQIKHDSTINYSDAMTHLTLDIIAEAGFSYHLNAMNNENEELVRAFGVIIALGIKPWIHVPFGGKVGAWLYGKELSLINNLMLDTIKRREEEKKSGNGDRPARDFLDLLLDAADKSTGRKLNMQEVRDEVFILFAAGHETTATTLTWAMVRAMQNPDMYERLVAEAEAVLGERDVPTYDDISKFKYMNAFLKETLRLHPPATHLSRRTPADVTLRGHFVPKGTEMFISPYLIQRDPAWWRDPLTFKPERFLSTEDGGSEEYRAPSEPMTFIPFTAGPRVCAGQNFFWIEGQTIFPALLKAFRFKPTPSLAKVKPTVQTGTMKTDIPVLVTATNAH
mmetsp:Transcript_4831/g.10167  ORF Transcript_4831/g.10167 Transcript_4831/m.10167 type:complete len:519 (-) Transcript_4831:111-1667(-)